MKDITTRLAKPRPNDIKSTQQQSAARKIARETRGGAVQMKFRSELGLPGRGSVASGRTWYAICRTAEAMDYVNYEIALLFKRLDGTRISASGDVVRAELGDESIASHVGV